MSKKNRSPRPSVDSVYLNAGEEIPGCGGRKAVKDGWCDPDCEPDFTWKKYREWRQIIKPSEYRLYPPLEKYKNYV